LTITKSALVTFLIKPKTKLKVAISTQFKTTTKLELWTLY